MCNWFLPVYAVLLNPSFSWIYTREVASVELSQSIETQKPHQVEIKQNCLLKYI